MLKWLDLLILKTKFLLNNCNLNSNFSNYSGFIKLRNIVKFLIIIILIVFIPKITNSAEILQINSSSSVLVGDQNRNLQIKLSCVEVDDKDEQTALSLLKREFPRGSKVKIKPIGFKENILLAKVFNLNESKEMSELLIEKDLTKEICRD